MTQWIKCSDRLPEEGLFVGWFKKKASLSLLRLGIGAVGLVDFALIEMVEVLPFYMLRIGFHCRLRRNNYGK